MTKGRLYRKYFNGTSEYEQYDYDTNSGYLYRIQFTAGGSTATVWQLTTMDEYSRIRQATIGATSVSWGYDGNNMLSQIAATGVQQYDYSFDVNLGNLNSRTNFLKSKTESFGYDSNNLDRLATVTGPVNQTLSYTTDKNGNIQSKSDAGTYAYNLTPYAVSGISNHQNISSTAQTINYYSFEKVKDITEGTKTADFVYNADQQRIRMILKDNGVTTKTRWYFGSSCERELVGSTTTQYIWIGGDAYTAVAVAKKVGTGSWTVYNIFRDHLGTITHLKTGSTISEYSFDAWGRRRDKDTWSYTLDSEPALFADRGFTAHEYLDDFKLYNMNGRMYDPVVARFLNPDPYIQSPDFTQNFNRYSYALNNPLKYTDPSGEFWWMIPVIFAGNYTANWLDNTINKGMSAKEAFRQTPITVGFNYSPSANQVSLPQLDAQKAAKHEEKISQRLDRFTMSQRGAGQQVSREDDYFQIYGEFSFSLGPQIGAELSLGTPLLAGFLQGPSMEVKYKPYLRYSESNGWTVGIDIEKNNINYKKGYSYPFNSYEKSSTYGIYEHPAFSTGTVETQKGLIQFRTVDGIEDTFFRLHGGTYVRPLIFGVGVDFGIEGPYDY